MRISSPDEPAELRRYSVSLQQTAAALFGEVKQQGDCDSRPYPASPDKPREPHSGQMR